MSLTNLLAPMSTQDFFGAHWGKKPLFLNGRADRFRDTPFELDDMCRRLATKPSSVGLKAQFLDTAGRHCEMPISARQIPLCFDAGMTICAGPLDHLMPAMREWTRALDHACGFAGAFAVMSYWSPNGAGFGWHYDEVGVFICQLRGAKRWWFSSAPVVDCPREPFVYSPEGLEKLRQQGIEPTAPPRDSEATSVVLEPGDLLYLPAGTWHRTEAAGRESLALTLGATGGGADQLVTLCLREWLRRDRSWSRALPFVDPQQLARGELPSAVSDELAERLGRLKRYVAELSVRDLARVWARDSG